MQILGKAKPQSSNLLYSFLFVCVCVCILMTHMCDLPIPTEHVIMA